jgi:hypothetical protein
LLATAKGHGITEKELISAWYKRAGKGALGGLATEGSTEALQEMSSAAAEKFVDENNDFFTPQNFERFLNAGLKGGIGGGVATGATNVAFGRKEAPKAGEAPPPEDTSTINPTDPTAPSTPPAAPFASIDELKAELAKKKEEVADVTKSTLGATDRASVSVPGGQGSPVPTPGVGTSGLDGVVDFTSPTSLIEGGDGKQQSPLAKAKPEVTVPEAAAPVESASPKTLSDQTKLPEGKIDFLDWLHNKGIEITDGSQDWKALEEQWKADAAPTPEEVDKTDSEVLPEIAKEAVVNALKAG